MSAPGTAAHIFIHPQFMAAIGSVGVQVARLSSDVTSWDAASTGGREEGRKKCEGEVTTESVVV